METLSLGLPFMSAFLEPETKRYGPRIANWLGQFDHMAGMWIVGEDYASRNK